MTPPPGPRTKSGQMYLAAVDRAEGFEDSAAAGLARKAVLAIEDELLSGPTKEAEARAGLDVERLARALETAVDVAVDRGENYGSEVWREVMAAAIATAYGGRDGLRAALERIAHPETVEGIGGFYCPWCGTNVDTHGTTCAAFMARAALASGEEGQ